MNVASTSWMIVLLNHGKKQHNITLDWTLIGFDDSETADVYDVWNRSSIVGTNVSTSFTATVPSHGTIVVRIAKTSVNMAV